MMPRSGSLDNRQGPRASPSPSPVGRGRGPNFGRGPERDPGPERRDRGPERVRGPERGREPMPLRDDRGPDLGRGAPRGRGPDRSMDRGRGPEFSNKGQDRDKFQDRGRELQRSRDGDPQRDKGSERMRDVRGGLNRGRAPEREGFVRQGDRSFEDPRASRDSSADSRQMDKLKSVDQQRGPRNAGRSDFGRQADLKDRRDDSRSRERREDSKGSSNSQREKPDDRDRNQHSERPLEKIGRDFPKKPGSVERTFASDSPAPTRGRGDRSQSSEKPYPDQEQDQRTTALEHKAVEVLSRASTQGSKESTPLKESSPARLTEEVFSDWSEGGSDELLNQSPPVEERNVPPAGALESLAVKWDSSSEPPKKDKPKSDKRSEDLNKQEGTDGRSLRSLSYGSSSSQYSSVSSDLLGQTVPGGSVDRGTLPKAGLGQDDEKAPSSLDANKHPPEEYINQEKELQDKISGKFEIYIPTKSLTSSRKGTTLVIISLSKFQIIINHPKKLFVPFLFLLLGLCIFFSKLIRRAPSIVIFCYTVVCTRTQVMPGSLSSNQTFLLLLHENFQVRQPWQAS